MMSEFAYVLAVSRSKGVSQYEDNFESHLGNALCQRKVLGTEQMKLQAAQHAAIEVHYYKKDDSKKTCFSAVREADAATEIMGSRQTVSKIQVAKLRSLHACVTDPVS